jgi:hypothetical protein
MMSRLRKYQEMLFWLGAVIVVIIAVSELFWRELSVLALLVACFGSFYILFAAFGNHKENDNQ